MLPAQCIQDGARRDTNDDTIEIDCINTVDANRARAS